MKRWVAVLLSLAFAADAAAQQLPPPPDLPNPSTGGNIARSGVGITEFFSSRTPYEFWLTCIIIIFGLTVLFLLLWNVRGIRDRRAEDVTRSVVVVTVIVGTLILVTAGYSNDQIAPAFGLFGTIVGYVLGRLTPPSSATAQAEPDGNKPAAPPGQKP